VGQVLLGTVLPLLALGSTQVIRQKIPMWLRRRMYFVSALLIISGVMAMRWNVVIGGQLFSKSLRGFTTFKFELRGQEGWLVAGTVMILPYILLAIFVPLFLRESEHAPREATLASTVDDHSAA
jgi:predicted membrane protein